ncbi:MAG: formylglycine-generating enzyme family protein [Treponemataceae bacterium]
MKAMLKYAVPVVMAGLLLLSGCKDPDVVNGGGHKNPGTATGVKEGGSISKAAIVIGSKTYEKTGEVEIVPYGTSKTVKMTDDSSWASYYNGNDPLYKGVFIKDQEVILKPYVLSQYEVTRELYQEIMNGAPPASCKVADGENVALTPMVNVNWFQAVCFCNKLSKKLGYDMCYTIEGVDNWDDLNHSSLLYLNSESQEKWKAATVDVTKNGYRLPSEAEWEFASRGGSIKKADWSFCFSGINSKNQLFNESKKDQDPYNFNGYLLKDENLDKCAWYKENSKKGFGFVYHEVGKKIPNALHLFDMTGHAKEWCNDFYDDENGKKVVKGGCLADPAHYCSVSKRDGNSLTVSMDTGIRLCRTLTK